ncbi:MAG: TauD/TfdA family dioxygenase, partial [Acidobacteria bacterium]|nr:TauD/TfdA family dioxygenase [Acidobacteriota bacterium]
MKQTSASGPGFNRFRKVQPKPVHLPQGELVTLEPLHPDNPLPLVIRPAVEDVDLAEWAGSHKELLEEKLLLHGAILFRGFKVRTAEEFERVAGSVTPDLVDDNGELPRTNISGKIHAVSYAPPEEAILWHNENSFCPGWPMKLWFYCHLPPKAGGETPVVDNRKLLERLDPDVRRAFEEKKIMYLRNFGRGLDFDWPVSFQTDDRKVVEARCRESGTDFEWKPDGGLRTRSVRPAILEHPKTGEKV